MTDETKDEEVIEKRQNNKKPKLPKTVKMSTFIMVLLIIGLVITNAILFINRPSPNPEPVPTSIPQPTSTPIVISSPSPIYVSPSTIREVIVPAAELVSYKYFYTDADVYEKSAYVFKKVKVPFSTDKTVFTYSGVISVGVNLVDTEIEVDNDKKTIQITLDEPYIMSNQIDNDTFQAYDVKNSIFTSVNISEFVALKDALEKNQEEKLMKNDEFWKQTKISTTNTISSLINASKEAEDYTISYVWKDSD